MPDDCTTFQESSQEIRSWIVDQPEVKEESLTDWLLRDISKRIKNVHYKAFSRTAEARVTGADWEWWFLFKSGSYRMRIQAKKLSSTKNNYAGIAYTNQHGLQIEKLIDDSLSVNAMPLYAFYSSAAYTPFCPRGQDTEGVYIAGARAIRADLLSGGIRKVTDTDALKSALPLSCIVCCPMAADGHHGLDSFLNNYFRADARFDDDEGENVRDSEHPRGYYAEIPNFISSFLESRGDLPEWWEREFSRDLGSINNLVAYDLREMA